MSEPVGGSDDDQSEDQGEAHAVTTCTRFANAKCVTSLFVALENLRRARACRAGLSRPQAIGPDAPRARARRAADSTPRWFGAVSVRLRLWNS